MKHLSVRPAAAKLMISCEAFVAAAVLGVVLFLNFYHSYNDGILYSERLNQMKEVTTQLFEGLNDVLELRWADARSHTKQLMRSGIHTSQELYQFIKEQEEVCEMPQKGTSLVAVDTRGRYYTSSGAMGLTENINYFFDEPEHVSFVSSSLIGGTTNIVFMYRLSSPMEISDGDDRISLMYFGTVQAMQELGQYFNCKAYNDNNSVYVLDQNGSKIFSSNSIELISGHNVYSVLRQMEYLHGSNFEQTQQELNSNGIAYSNAVLDGEEYYYALRRLDTADWTLMFLIPSSYVAVNTVNLVDITGSIIMTFAGVMLVLCVGFVYLVLRSQQKEALRAERNNTRRMEELNSILEAKNEQLRQANTEIENARRAAEVANKAKTTFLSNMSHDIRTPMNAIVGIADLLGYETESSERIKEYTRRLQNSSHHLLGLLNDILDMSRIESGMPSLNIENLELSEQISQIETMIRTNARERRQQFEIRTSMIRHEQINGDGTRLRQILLNILTNAVKYTPDGGRIIFTITELDSEPGYAEYQFTISDNGMGMSQEFISTIFDPFTRAENSVTNKVQGTGLGMAITKNIIDIMGGSIDIQSEPGKGSRFTVTLKFQADENEQSGIKGMLMIGQDDNVEAAAQAHGVETENARDISAAAELLGHGGYDVVLITSGVCENISGDDISRLRGASEKPVKIAGICCDDTAQRLREMLDCAVVMPFFWRKLENGLADENKKEESESSSALSGVRFLCAEDNEMNAVILEANLKWRGASCRIFPDGKSLVEHFAAADPGEYDMILMDVQMPLMNGYEAAQAIRKSSNPDGKTIPIIAMTANAFSDDIRACLSAGMDAHVSKPVDMSAFEKTVRSLREDKKRLVQRCKSDRSRIII